MVELRVRLITHAYGFHEIEAKTACPLLLLIGSIASTLTMFSMYSSVFPSSWPKCSVSKILDRCRPCASPFFSAPCSCKCDRIPLHAMYAMSCHATSSESTVPKKNIKILQERKKRSKDKNYVYVYDDDDAVFITPATAPESFAAGATSTARP